MALYADENFPLRVIEELRQLGQDVLTAFEDGQARRIAEAIREAADLRAKLIRVYRQK